MDLGFFSQFRCPICLELPSILISHVLRDRRNTDPCDTRDLGKATVEMCAQHSNALRTRLSANLITISRAILHSLSSGRTEKLTKGRLIVTPSTLFLMWRRALLTSADTSNRNGGGMSFYVLRHLGRRTHTHYASSSCHSSLWAKNYSVPPKAPLFQDCDFIVELWREKARYCVMA